MSILEEIWYGNAIVSERCIKPGSDYQRLLRRCCECEEQIMSALGGEDKRLFETLENAGGELSEIAEKEAFIYGFRLGAKFIMEIMADHDYQLVPKLQ